mmetsp:Transcript_81221/g.218428  ORF Transcript_81221/g.218428 Transcript_81221/m.218428 type:complete len:146 (-) Transcript_81221:357-794(-)|eukprot:CAMPEP_0113686394 /NCGR_PEP_ID=MMETSP0038_2-20120614/15267_1 /TAXON_ID=2898 /ORGANISM="Cryptomonas paramecium" /LENGTH=145 /DNA_ID=CAMNT_0000606715 /DNA_START=415 /DNA_END=852 /DNA_ORIENTATION=- /assembly_acc=CAM_ASM_000170
MTHSVGSQFMGVLEGAGRAADQTAALFGGMWAVGLPVAAVFSLLMPAWGLRGLWCGLLLGEIAVTSIAAVAVARFDWQQVSDAVVAATVAAVSAAGDGQGARCQCKEIGEQRVDVEDGPAIALLADEGRGSAVQSVDRERGPLSA